MIVEIILSILTLIGICLSYYLVVRNKLTNNLTTVINTAEDSDLVAEEKMQLAIAELNKLVPMILKPFIPESFLRKITQNAFDKIEEYAKKQLSKK